jgi:hypothetical protein
MRTLSFVMTLAAIATSFVGGSAARAGNPTGKLTIACGEGTEEFFRSGMDFEYFRELPQALPRYGLEVSFNGPYDAPTPGKAVFKNQLLKENQVSFVGASKFIRYDRQRTPIANGRRSPWFLLGRGGWSLSLLFAIALNRVAAN